MATEQDKSASEPEDDSNEDYYIDELGRFVFTRGYHLRRGYCCMSGCRHCPYGFNADAEAPEPDVKG